MLGLYKSHHTISSRLSSLVRKKIVAGRHDIFLLLPARNRVVCSFGNLRFGVDISEAVRSLDHNLCRWIFQPIFIHMVTIALGVVLAVFLALNAEVESRKVHIATDIRYG